MAADESKVEPLDLKLEVVIIGVSDVDRSRAFYEQLGWRLDANFDFGDFHAVQVTPQNSGASIIFGKGIPAPKPGAVTGMVLAVADVTASRAELAARGANISEVFHYAGGPFNVTTENPRVSGPDPEGRSYYSFATFEDPDGNGFLLQEIHGRLPGREWAGKPADVAALAELLHETEQHHGQYEKSHGKHNWWDWYAPYFNARQNGSSPEEASAAADRYMEGLGD